LRQDVAGGKFLANNVSGNWNGGYMEVSIPPGLLHFPTVEPEASVARSTTCFDEVRRKPTPGAVALLIFFKIRN
jgi:hypothetical protein